MWEGEREWRASKLEGCLRGSRRVMMVMMMVVVVMMMMIKAVTNTKRATRISPELALIPGTCVSLTGSNA